MLSVDDDDDDDDNSDNDICRYILNVPSTDDMSNLTTVEKMIHMR